MTDPVALLQLASEVEAGTGPDRELDARVWAAIHGGRVVDRASPHWMGFVWLNPRAELLGDAEASPPLTASVDASLGLLREVLPGWQYELHSNGAVPMAFLGEINVGYGDDDGTIIGSSAAGSLPRAIVAAVLRAAARGEGVARRAPISYPSAD